MTAKVTARWRCRFCGVPMDGRRLRARCASKGRIHEWVDSITGQVLR